MSAINLTSLDALHHFRAALIEYADATHETMVGLDLELRRGLQWMLETQPGFWSREEKRLYDLVIQAKADLSRARGMAMKGDTPACTEQKKALERATAQLRHAEEKSKITKRWGQIIDHEASEFQGRANQFASLLEGDLPKAISLIDRAIAAVESYMQRGRVGGGTGGRADGGTTGRGDGGETGRTDDGTNPRSDVPVIPPIVPPSHPPTVPPSPPEPPSPEAVDASR
jgi:hypothetical protein